MSAQFEFVDAPPDRESLGATGKSNHSKDRLTKLVLPLVHYPGRWARFENEANSAASSVRRSLVLQAVGDWEAAIRRGDLYVRFVGPHSTQEER